jgi:hypothetical protein
MLGGDMTSLELSHFDSWMAAHADSVDDDLCTMRFCAEKCRYHGQMLCRPHRPHFTNASFPAPVCERMSTTERGDIYQGGAEQDRRAEARNKRTAQLVLRSALHPGCAHTSGAVVTARRFPMMKPDEFEFITKTLLRLRPRTYLEWGSGMSTSWYPLLSARSYVIDNYAPWCINVQRDATVACLSSRGRLRYICTTATRADGSVIALGETGIPKREDKELVAAQYLGALDEITSAGVLFDAALVDGRFRLAAALKLLNFVHGESVIFVHDFWMRQGKVFRYNRLLEYYDVIGRARSAVALRRKPRTQLPHGWERAFEATWSKQAAA